MVVVGLVWVLCVCATPKFHHTIIAVCLAYPFAPIRMLSIYSQSWFSSPDSTLPRAPVALIPLCARSWLLQVPGVSPGLHDPWSRSSPSPVVRSWTPGALLRSQFATAKKTLLEAKRVRVGVARRTSGACAGCVRGVCGACAERVRVGACGSVCGAERVWSVCGACAEQRAV